MTLIDVPSGDGQVDAYRANLAGQLRSLAARIALTPSCPASAP